MITVATYNILHGHHSQLILESIKFLLDQGVDTLCIQEADPPFPEVFDEFLHASNMKDWKVRYVHVDRGGNLATAWNSSKLDLKEFEVIPLPVLPKPSNLQRLKGHNIIMQRVGAAAGFLVEGKLVRITNVHLAWEGGVRHRLEQLRHLRDVLAKHPVEADVLGGDFNTVAPARLRRLQQKRVEAILGPEWTNALASLAWSWDTAYTAPQDKGKFVANIARPLGLKLRARLDYLFSRNLKVMSADMFDLPGSDHRPLVGTFDFE